MDLLTILLASALAAVANLVGVYLVRLTPDLTRRFGRMLVALAGGIVLGAAFLHFLPEAAEKAEQAHVVALITFLALYLVETHSLPHIHETDSHQAHSGRPAGGLVALLILGFALHHAFDGLAIAAGYSSTESLGHTSVVAVFAHKVPEGIATLTLLRHWSFPEPQALRLAWLLAAVTPLAALLAAALIGGDIPGPQLGLVLAVVAGTFLYVAAADLLPEIQRGLKFSESTLLVFGAALMWLVKLLF